MTVEDIDFEIIFRTLEYILSEKLLEEIKNSSEEGLYDFHFGFGTWLRNNFLLEDTKLFLFLKRKGNVHKDEMSLYVIKGFYKFLNT